MTMTILKLCLKKIKNLEQRVVALQASLLATIPRKLAELREIKKHASGYSGAHTANDMRMNNLEQGCEGPESLQNLCRIQRRLRTWVVGRR